MVRVYGCSDDLVEITGDLSEELNPHDTDGFVLAFSDGTALKGVYDGCWRFTPISRGTSIYSKIEAVTDDSGARRPDGSPEYSDVVTLDGDVKWVAMAHLRDYVSRAKGR